MKFDDRVLLWAGLLLASACAAKSGEELVYEEDEIVPAGETGGGGASAVDAAGGARAAADAGREAAPAVADAWTPDSGRTPHLGDLDAKGRVLIWAQEFDQPDLDASAWNILEGHRFNGIQVYTDSSENTYIEGGDLVFQAIATTAGGTTTYTAGQVNTLGLAAFMYGRIEARIKMPSAKGSWPAFWMLREDGTAHPAGGEIDVMEYVSQDQYAIYGTPHYVKGGQHVSGSQMDHRFVLPDAAWADYHVYALEWTAKELAWYCDATLYNRLDISKPFDSATPFNNRFYLINQYAVGGEWPEPPDPGAYPDQMRTDWVRVWQAPGD